MRHWMFWIALVAGCSLDERLRCKATSDCFENEVCTPDHVCREAVSCTPQQCGTQCGDIDDGCGGTLSCGMCPLPAPPKTPFHDQCTGPCTSDATRMMFTTSALYEGGALGGLTGADAKCQNHASGAHFTGVFRAWLSDSTGSPSTRMVHGAGEYVLVDGTVVARDWNDLNDGQLEHAVNLDETGEVHTINGELDCNFGPLVWTGTDFDGKAYTEAAAGGSCGNWDDPHSNGLFGSTVNMDAFWSVGCISQCYLTGALYCVEQ